MAASKEDLAFICKFQKHVAALLEATRDLINFRDEHIDPELEAEDPNFAQTEANRLATTFFEERQTVTQMYDRATDIADKYGLVQQFHLLLKIKPSEQDELNSVNVFNLKFRQ